MEHLREVYDELKESKLQDTKSNIKKFQEFINSFSDEVTKNPNLVDFEFLYGTAIVQC